MADREKVIKALDYHKKTCVCNGCLYYGEDDTEEGFCPVYDDAITLLREQEPAVANWHDQTDPGDAYMSWRCSRCGHYSPTETRYAYCPYCGAKMEVKRDG